MARCFPYPLPEGFLLGIGGGGGDGGRALLGGPIKPHAETERHAKKDTEKLLKRKSSGSDKVEETKPKRIKFTTKSGGSQKRSKGTKEEDEESSGVTEEHGPPVCSQSPCHSSESVRVINQRAATTDTSIERKRNVFRIKLNVPKPVEPVRTEQILNVPKPVEPVRTEQTLNVPKPVQPVRTEQTGDPSTCSSSQQKNTDLSGRNSDIPPSTSGLWKDEKDVSAKVGKTQIDVPSRSKKSKKMTIQDLYESLTNGWAPPALQLGPSQPEDEDDWLFSSRKPASRSGPEAQLKSVSSCGAASSCTSLWPRAQFLPEVEVHALPYTVPF